MLNDLIQREISIRKAVESVEKVKKYLPFNLFSTLNMRE